MMAHGAEQAVWTLQRDGDYAQARLCEGERGLQLRLVMWGVGESAHEPHVVWSQLFRDANRKDKEARDAAENTRREMLTRGWRDVNDLVV